MATDYESGAKKTIDLTIKAEKISSDILKEALQEFMAGKAEKVSGRKGIGGETA